MIHWPYKFCILQIDLKGQTHKRQPYRVPLAVSSSRSCTCIGCLGFDFKPSKYATPRWLWVVISRTQEVPYIIRMWFIIWVVRLYFLHLLATCMIPLSFIMFFIMIRNSNSSINYDDQGPFIVLENNNKIRKYTYFSFGRPRTVTTCHLKIS